MQEIADQAKTVMGQQVNNSGTPERAALMGAILAPHTTAAALPFAAPFAGLYTRTGNRAFRALATMSPAARARARRLIERATAAGAPGMSQPTESTAMSGLFGLGQ
jgi:hypothetical protein